MKILHVVAGLWKHTGGPAEVIPQLCEALVRENCEVTLLTIEGPHSESTLKCLQNGVEVKAFPALPLLPMRYSPAMARYLKNNIHCFDIIHNHGQWLHANWAAFKYAQQSRKPFVTTPHGTLVPGMLARSRFKKNISWNLIDKYLIEYANVIHALSPVERNEMALKVGRKNSQKIRVIPNGADIWELPKPVELLASFPFLQRKKVILFLSRVHPIKGIIDLLEAWKLCCRKHPAWHLLIVGPVEEEIKAQISCFLENKELQEATTFAGPIYGSARKEAFALADIFILPSYGEGLPTALLEALSCKLPVICTTECNFLEAEKAGAAFSGPAGKETLVSNIQKMLMLTDNEREKMGEFGQKIVREHYSWENIAKCWVQTYNSITK